MGEYRLAPELDFMVVGAPKSGTTSLFYALKKHRQIRLPKGKEVPFFLNKDNVEENEWVRFYHEVFGNPQKKDMIRYGTISPIYWMQPGFPKKLKRFFPDIKVMIILRNPAKRFVSHYKMLYSHGAINMSFEDFLEEAFTQVRSVMKSEKYDPYNIAPYVALSSFYNIQLKKYRKYFQKEKIHVVILERLLGAPDEEGKKIFQFLGVRPMKWRFPKMHVSKKIGISSLIAEGVIRVIYAAGRNRIVRAMGRRILGSFRYSLGWWAVEKRKGVRKPPEIADGMYQRLVEYLQPEVHAFYREFGVIHEWFEDFPT